MKMYQVIILLSLLFEMVLTHPLSYQKVRFYVDPNKRHERSFGGHHHPWTFSTDLNHIWTQDELLQFSTPQFTLFNNGFELEQGPDFSNQIHYPDPLLLTGSDALVAVKYLYGRGELFYHQIPHIRALLNNQEKRKANGLEGHVLSSNRIGSPFYRQ